LDFSKTITNHIYVSKPMHSTLLYMNRHYIKQFVNSNTHAVGLLCMIDEFEKLLSMYMTISLCMIDENLYKKNRNNQLFNSVWFDFVIWYGFRALITTDSHSTHTYRNLTAWSKPSEKTCIRLFPSLRSLSLSLKEEGTKQCSRFIFLPFSL